MHVSQRKTNIPATPAESWLSDGRRVLHFKPVIWDRWQQELEVTSGEWLNDQRAPLLKRRQRLSREQALELWRQRRSEGWGRPAPRNGSHRNRRGWCFSGERQCQTNQSRRLRRARQCE